jgi:hypothetical protein
MAQRKRRQPLKSPRGAIIAKLRKPTAPPMRVEDDPTKYQRARERERIRRETRKP